MKKLISFLLSALLLLSVLTACSSSGSSTTVSSTPAKSSVQTTTVPETQPEASYEIISKNTTTWVDSIGTPWVQTIIEIENTGSVDLYLNSCSYDLEDASGSLVAAHSYVNVYPQVLASGEKGVIYNETTLDAAVDGDLTVMPHEDIEKSKIELVRFPISDISITSDQFSGIKVKGRVENTTDKEQTFVYVAALLYDADGSCIGVTFTILDKIAAGDKIGFEASSFSLPESVTADSVSSYEVYAYPNQFQF